MRQIRYAPWVKPFLTSLVLLGALCCFFDPVRYLGWGLLLQSAYLAVGYVCIYVAEVESDLMTEAKREAGDWNRLIVALSIYRHAHPAQAEATQRLQDLNRRFWREYMTSRRYLLRSELQPNSDFESRFEACNALARQWLEQVQAKVAQGQVEPEAAQREGIEAMVGFRQEH